MQIKLPKINVPHIEVLDKPKRKSSVYISPDLLPFAWEDDKSVFCINGRLIYF